MKELGLCDWSFANSNVMHNGADIGHEDLSKPLRSEILSLTTASPSLPGLSCIDWDLPPTGT